jgi:hypothetical protein
MTVAELIAWLQTQDQGATVEVLCTRTQGWSISTGWQPFVPEQHAEYSDLRGNPFVPADAPYRDARTLKLGEERA